MTECCFAKPNCFKGHQKNSILDVTFNTIVLNLEKLMSPFLRVF